MKWRPNGYDVLTGIILAVGAVLIATIAYTGVMRLWPLP